CRRAYLSATVIRWTKMKSYMKERNPSGQRSSADGRNRSSTIHSRQPGKHRRLVSSRNLRPFVRRLIRECFLPSYLRAYSTLVCSKPYSGHALPSSYLEARIERCSPRVCCTYGRGGERCY